MLFFIKNVSELFRSMLWLNFLNLFTGLRTEYIVTVVSLFYTTKYMKMKNMIFNRFKILFPRSYIFDLMYVASVSVCTVILLLLMVYIDGYEVFAKDYKPTHIIIKKYFISFLIIVSIFSIAMIYEMTIG